MKNIIYNNFLRLKILNIVSILLSFFIVVAIIYIAFWEFNILKKEVEMSPEIKMIEDEINYLRGINLSESVGDLKNKLPQAQVLSEPTLTNEMIGKRDFFE
ncbi:MAG: hypothetical protein KatS3mg094_463 [Candidatus Parcubacteria bacterium]|nr:MAG: hypothetical protein KatS3mg094_463 [Candidatus Parcubacteria bacterium]